MATSNLPSAASLKIWNGLSEGLKSLLTLGDDTSATSELAHNPVMLAEATAVEPALREAATAPAGPEGVRRVIGRRLATFPVQKMTDEQWAAWWQDRIDVLRDLPEAALEAGMAAWLRSPEAEFMPKPGKLRELALQTPNRAARAYERVKRARAIAATPAPVYDAADRPKRETVDAMLQGYRRTVAELGAEREAARIARRPPVQGRTDERGLTEAMRATLARARAD